MKDQATKDRFIELWAQGWIYQRIAEELSVSKQTLINWSRDLTTEIANLRAISLEALREKYCVLMAKRIELFGEKLKGLEDELGKRQLADIPTEKLCDLVLRYGQALKKEEKPLSFSIDGLGFHTLDGSWVA